MKNVKNIIAIVTLVSVLGINNSFAANSTASSSTTGTWFGNVYSYITSYFTGTASSSNSAGTGQTRSDKLAVNHNETLVIDEN